MASLLYLKNSFNLSDEELVSRWSENVVWQFFSGMEYYEPRLPCDATQIGRLRTAIGEEGLEQLLKFTRQSSIEATGLRIHRRAWSAASGTRLNRDPGARWRYPRAPGFALLP